MLTLCVPYVNTKSVSNLKEWFLRKFRFPVGLWLGISPEFGYFEGINLAIILKLE